MIGATLPVSGIALTRPLADQGDDFAQYNLGIMYARGQGVAQSLAEAFKWFRLSANQGNASAQYSLGVMFAEGNGVPQNNDEAVKWYRLAANQGNAVAQYNLGLMHLNRKKGVAQSDVEAVKWFRKSADQGHAGAQSTLGIMLANGKWRAVKQCGSYRMVSPSLRLNWAQRFLGQYNLGTAYALGQGVPQDYVVAAHVAQFCSRKGANLMPQTQLEKLPNSV